MVDHTLGPSVTSRSRSGATHWRPLVAYPVLTVVVGVYVSASIVLRDVRLETLLGAILVGGTAFVSPFAYFFLFKDAVHLAYTESDWDPNWALYISVGLGIPLGCYVLVQFGLFAEIAPLFVVGSLILSTGVTTGIYLSRRHRYVGQS